MKRKIFDRITSILFYLCFALMVVSYLPFGSDISNLTIPAIVILIILLSIKLFLSLRRDDKEC